MIYALYHLTVDGRTIELSHRDELPWPHIVMCDQWLESHRELQLYRYRRDRLAELKETHGCGYRPGLEAIR